MASLPYPYKSEEEKTPEKKKAFDIKGFQKGMAELSHVNNKDPYADDLIDSAQAGFYEATGNLMTGTRQLLTDKQEPWDIEQSQYGAAQRNLEEIDPQRRNEMEKWGFGENDELTASNTGMQVANALGSLAPTMVPGGIAGKGLQVGTKVAGLGTKAQKVAQAAGYGATGAAMIGGSSANEVGQAIDSMSDDDLKKMPEYLELFKQSSDPELARKAFKYQQEQIASKQGAALGGVSMAIAGPILQRIAMGAGGQGALNRITSGAVTEGLQEGFEEGGQGVIANVNTGKPTWDDVGERAIEGAALGAGAGGAVGTAGAGVNALTRNPEDIPIADDQGNIVGYRDNQTGEQYSDLTIDNTGLPTEEVPQATRTPDQATGTLDKALLTAGIDAQNPVNNDTLFQSQVDEEVQMIQSALNAGELSPEQAEVALQRLNKSSGNLSSDNKIPAKPASEPIQQDFSEQVIPQVNVGQQAANTETDALPQTNLEATITGLENDPNWSQNDLGEWIDNQGNKLSLPSDDTTTQTVDVPKGTPVSFQGNSGKTIQGEVVGTNSKGNYRLKMPSGIIVTKKPTDIEVIDVSTQQDPDVTSIDPIIPGNQVSFTTSGGKQVNAEVTEMVNPKVAKIKLAHNGKTIRKQVKLLTQSPEQGNKNNESSFLPTNESPEPTPTETLSQNKQMAEELITPDNITQASDPIPNNPVEKIQDVGEKIGGARKDVWTGFREKVSAELSEDEIVKLPLSKTFPESDYTKLSEQGADPTSLALIKAMRDEIPAKGVSNHKNNRYKTAVIQLREAAAKILDDPGYAQKFLDKAKGTPALKGVTDKVALMVELGFPQKPINLKNITLRNRQYSMYDGVEGKFDKWIVDDVARSRRSFGSTGGQIAVTDTREDAIKALKEYLEKQANNPKGKRKTKFEIFKYRGAEGAKGWVIGKKIRAGVFIDVKKGFKSSKEARGYLDNNQEQLESKLKKLKVVPNHRRDVNEERVGDDYRKGENVTANDFKDKFGFNGVEFGNWVGQGKRQEDINEAYDGLMDLSHVLGVPPEAMSLNGELSIAFGARGSGGKHPAKAHYESDKIVINLTKKNGAGSLAHEFFHGLDNYFSRMRGEGQSFVTDRPYELMNNGVRPEVLEKFKEVVKAITDSGLPNRSVMLDKTRSKTYWSKVIEMSARSFESYVIDKLKAKNVSNDYLANIVSEKAWGKQEGYPYPKTEDKESINKAFDDLFSTIKTKETDKGVALFSRAKTTDISPALSHDVVVPIVNRVMSRFRTLPFEVVASESALPDKIQQDAKEQGATGEIKAVYWRNKVYVVSDTFHSDLEVEEAVLHEVSGHYGARVLYGKDIEKSFKRLYSGLRASGVRKIAKKHGIDLESYIETAKKMTHEQRAAFLVDELLAHLQGVKVYESLPAIFKRLLKEFIGAIRHQLKQRGFIELSKLSDFDLAYLLRRMNKAAQDGKTAKESDKALFMTAFHGTPHTVDKFSTNNIGTGEGAQAQGWGLYFAGERGVADFYRKKLSEGQSIPVDVLKEYFKPGNVIPGYGGFDKVISFAGDSNFDWNATVIRVNKNGEPAIGERERIHSTLPSAKNIERITGKKMGNLYGVDLKPEQAEYLDWDKPLTQQSQHVRDAIINMGMGSYINETTTGKDFYNTLTDFYKPEPDSEWMIDKGEAQKQASLELANAGIRGNKYMDASSRIGGKGDFNYVIFSDEDIQITARFSRKLKQPKEMANRLMEAVNSSSSVAAFLKNKTEDWRPNWLGALTLRQLADVGKQELPQVKDYVDLNTLMQTERNKTTDKANEQAEVWRKYAAKNRKEADQLANLMHDSTMAGVDPSKDFNASEENQATKKHIALLRNRFSWTKDKEKRQATKEQINELQKQSAKKRTAFPVLKRRYEQLSDDAKTLYQDVRDAYTAQSKRTLNALEERIADSELTGKQKKALIDKMRLQHEQTKAEGPYFPLARFGSLWLSAKSSNGENEFYMFENYSDMKRSEKQLKAEGYTINAQGRKIENAKFINGASEGFMGDLNKVLQKNGITPDSPLMDEIYQAYLRTMPDLSLRKNFIHRKQTKGYSNDALRAFASQMTHGAIQAARLRYGGKMSQLLQDMTETVKQSDDATKPAALLNEMNKRHEWVMNPTNSKIAQKASSIGFAWYLGVSPAAAMVNLTQNALMAMPVIGAKHGMTKTFTKMNKVLGEFLSAKGDLNQSLKGKRLQAFKQMQETGAIDMSMSHNLAGIGDTDTLHYNPTQHKVMNGISFLFHKAEVLNRAVTGMTAYDLHFAKHKDHNGAIKYAEEAIWESQYDYANANRARFMQGDVAKVLLMFRQYSQNVTYYLWRNFYQSFKGESKEVRLEARKKLTGTLAISTMMSGALGLPLVTTGFAMANLAQGLFGDNDEPYDAEVETRSFFADYFGKEAAKYILDGSANQLTGASIASRVALNDLWLRAPNRELSGRDEYHYYLEQIAGPMGGIVLNAMRGTQLIEEGKIQRGFETMLPKALKDAAKALRYEQEGVNNLKGNPLIDNVSAYEEIIQAMGFSPARVNEQYTINNALKNYESHILKRRSFLLAQYAMATQSKDNVARQKVFKQMRDFSTKYPKLKITGKTLRRSMKSRFRYANTARNGINLNKNLQNQLLDKVAF